MKLSRDKPDTKERARLMHDFMTRCAARGIKVTLRLRQLYDPETQTERDRLYLAARSTVDMRDPVNLEEPVDGDIRDTILLVALKIGLKPTIA